MLRPGYEYLAGEMIEYAETAYPKFDEPLELVLISGQTSLIDAAKARGYELACEEPSYYFDFRQGKLEFPLPDGYRFVDANTSDPLKTARCLWNGFNKSELGDFKDWDVPTKNDGRSPFKLYQNVLGAAIAPAPHATYEYTTIIADENGEYVLWWCPKTKLTYMEPLCTVPEHQHKGLAAAALSHHDSILRPLGAEVMTGGGNEFYKRIGYQYTHLYGHYVRKE